MFYSITGKVVYYDTQFIAVECNGIAFKCFTTMNTLKTTAQKGATITLFTYLGVKEDALDLYGFSTEKEMECFKLLLTVSGIGPKAALAILSALSVEQLAVCIASSDVKSITQAKGVGPKVAQRVILELKDKLAKGLDLGALGAEIEIQTLGSQTANDNKLKKVVDSLVEFTGKPKKDVIEVISKLDPELSENDLFFLGNKALH